YHITAPSEDGDGAFRCMNAALKRAGITPAEIDYINAHGTSAMADGIELGAVERVVGNAAGKISMSSTKSCIGHLLGAAGAVEAIFSILAIRDRVAPPEPEYMPEPKRPSRRARHPLVIAGNAIFTIILVIALAGGLAWSFGKHKFEAAGPLDREKIVNIPKGLGLRDIADLLARENVIDQPFVFIGGVLVLKAKDDLKYGEYKFAKQITVRDAIETIVEGKVVQHAFTIP